MAAAAPLPSKQPSQSAVERKLIDLTQLKAANVPIFFIVGRPGSGKTIVLDSIKEAMVKAVEDKKCKGFLIDGYPREVQQGIDFEREIQPSKLVFYFDVTNEKTLIERLLKRAQTSGRVDDNLETISKRLLTIKTATAPVVDHYKNSGTLLNTRL